MVYYSTIGHNVTYEIEDVARAFRGQEKLMRVDAMPQLTEGDLFVQSQVESGSNGYYFHTIVVDPDGKETPVSAGGLVFKGSDDNQKKQLKREVQRQVYLSFSKYTGRELPWGILTGVRPAKIVHKMLEKGYSSGDISGRLQDYYMLSPSKTSVLMEVAQNEHDILRQSVPDTVGLYIGIPFCTTRCLYCSFTSNSMSDYRNKVGDYLKALRTEMEGVRRLLDKKGLRIESIYIGGGTPTALDAPDLQKLLDDVAECFDLTSLKEYTVEAGRPDTIDLNKLEIIKDSQADRISINPQTMNAATLKAIGRDHTPEDVEKAFNLARQLEFDNINMDVIAGLPGEDIDSFRYTMDKIALMKPDSLTVHTMAIKRASRLNERLIEQKEAYRLMDAGQASAAVDMAGSYAGEMGMKPYYLYRQKNIVGNLENIGYCRPGCESVYNVQIMEERQTIIALGAGGTTKVVFPEENRIERAFNVKNVDEYISRIDEMLERKKALLLQTVNRQ